MSNRPNTTTHTIRNRPFTLGTGIISEATNFLILVHTVTSLVDYFTNKENTSTGAAAVPITEPSPSSLKHVTTEQWVSSFEHETAVLLDLRSAELTSSQALAGLRKLYPRKEDIPGVRLLANGSKMLIVFASTELQEHALLYGFQLNDHMVVYGTKALDGQYKHTLLTIEGLHIEDHVTLRTKLESSLNHLFLTAVDPRNNQDLIDRNPWPPTVYDIFYHQSNGGYYNGKVTVILRGTVKFLQQSIELQAYNNESFNCKIQHFSYYCQHCMRVDRHLPQHCPRVL